MNISVIREGHFFFPLFFCLVLKPYCVSLEVPKLFELTFFIKKENHLTPKNKIKRVKKGINEQLSTRIRRVKRKRKTCLEFLIKGKESHFPLDRLNNIFHLVKIIKLQGLNQHFSWTNCPPNTTHLKPGNGNKNQKKKNTGSSFKSNTSSLYMLYDSSSASSPPIRCRLLSKTALKDSRSARSCSWNILVLLDPPVFPLEVEFSSSRNGFDFCASVSEKQTKTDYLSWTFCGNNKSRLNLSTDEKGYTRNPKSMFGSEKY